MNDLQKKPSIFQNPLVVVLGALLCCALWGSATPFIKTGYALLLPEKDVPSTILFAGIRFTLAGLLTVLIYSVARRKVLYPKRENLPRVLVIAAFQTVIQYIFFYVGLANTSGVKGTILSGSSAFFSVLIASLIFKQEKLTTKKIVACLFGLAGIILVNLQGLDFTMNFFGDAFVLFSTISLAFSSVLIKRFSKHEDPVVISGYQFIVGGAVMIVGALLFGGRVVIDSWQAVLMLTYLAILSALAYSLWGILLKYNPVSKVSIYNFMTPVFGVLLSWLMLTESSNVDVLNVLLSLVLVCSGIILLNFKKEK